MKLILPLIDVPLGSTVTKVTGTKEYTVRDSFEIHGAQRQIIKADPTVRFLVAANGDVWGTNGDTEVAWHVEPHILQAWLYQKTDGPSQ